MLFSQQRLHRTQIPAELLALDVRLLVRDPALHHVRLPHELQVRGIVDQASLPARGQRGQMIELRLQRLDALFDAVGVVVALLDQALAALAYVAAPLAMRLEVGLEGVVLFQQA